MPPSRHVAFVSQTPDISQKGMPNGHYCAPCAVANLLFQFDARGILQLPKRFAVGDQRAVESAGRALAELLGDGAHMNAIGRDGTDRFRLVNGLDRFLREAEMSLLDFHYVGIRSFAMMKIDEGTRSRVTATVAVPGLKVLQQFLSEGHGVAILFGSYRPDPGRKNRLERLGGH